MSTSDPKQTWRKFFTTHKIILFPFSFTLIPLIGFVLVINETKNIQNFVLDCIAFSYLVPGSLVSLALFGLGVKNMWLNDFFTLIISMMIYYLVGVTVILFLRAIWKRASRA